MHEIGSTTAGSRGGRFRIFHLQRLAGGIAAVFAVLLLLASSLSAQTDLNNQEPFATWNETAKKAQRLLQNDFASQAALERLRAVLAEQRDRAFDLSQEANIPARAIEAQIEALGPPPAEGKTEPEDVAARRAELTEELARANAPTLAASEAFERAELLVSEIDARLRAGQRKELLRHLPSPLLPANWLGVPAELKDRTTDFLGDINNALTDEVASGRIWRALPQALALAVAGLFLIFFVSGWMVSRLKALRERERSASRSRLLSIGASFSQFAIPVLGLGLLFLSPGVLDLRMPRGQGIVEFLPWLVAILVIAHLVGDWIFGARTADDRLFNLNRELADRGYRLSLILGVFLAMEYFLVVSGSAYLFSPETRSVVSFLVILIGVVPLWGFGSLLLAAARDEPDKKDDPYAAPEESASLSRDLLWLMAILLRVSAILALAAAALGYANLARQAIAPMVVTLAVLGVAVHLQTLFVMVLRNALGETTKDEAEDAFLIPFLVTLILVFATLPILALVWGARMTDIAEFWRLLTTGVELGETRISLTTVFTLVIVFMLGLGITRWTQRLFRRTLLPRTRMDHGAKSSIVTGLGYVGLTITGFVALSSAGINLSSLAVVFGALSVGIGFGLQNIVSNFVSGIILLVERPVKEGDWIEVSGHSGVVKKIAVRSTRIEGFDRFDVIVPNSELVAGTVKNMTLSNKDGRVVLPVGVAYGSDVDKVREILLAALEHDNRILTFPQPVVLFVGMGDSSINFELRFFLPDIGTSLGVKSDVLFRIYSALNAEGIEIPFPQRDVNLKGLERLAEAIESLAHGTAASDGPRASQP